MSPRYAARRDNNEAELVTAALRLGAQVVKAPPLDLWVGVPRSSIWRPVEVKNKKGRYTVLQKEFFYLCSQNGLPYWTWRTVDDVIECLSPSR